MPSGSKRKKKSKKNTAAAGPVVIPNSKNQENVKEKVLVGAENKNEVFETPTLQFDREDDEEVNYKDAAGINTEFDVIEKEVILENVDRNVEEHVEVVDNDEKAAVQTDEVEAPSLDEKEIKAVLEQEEKANMKNGDANVNSKVSSSNSLDVETTIDDCLKSSSESLGTKNEQIVQVSEIPNVVECSQEMPGQINENLYTMNGKIPENSDSLIAAKEAEESSSGEYLNTLNEKIHVDAGSLVAAEGVKTLSTDTEKTEIVERTEVAHGPTIARRATFWNCCGLFDLIASSGR